MARRRVRGAQKGIHRRALIYYIIYPYTKAWFFHFYGKVEVSGVENIPRGEPVIFAPNHQNALMDALIVLFSAPQDVIFLARADIFRARFLAYALNSLKILPVFRQRDGAMELAKNEDIFSVSVNALKNRHYLCVMPEGNHGNQRRLRAFGKGIFRIAVAAQEEHGDKPFVKIIPVGLDFGDYVKTNASLYINYGKPIEISDYWTQYQEHQARGINAMKKRLIEDLKTQMIHIETKDHYDAVHGVRPIFNERMREILGISGSKLSDRFRADKEMIARLDHLAAEEKAAASETVVVSEAAATKSEEAASSEASASASSEASASASSEASASASAGSSPSPLSPLKSWAEKVERYHAEVQQMNIRDWVVRNKGYGFAKTMWNWISLLLTFPFFLYGFLLNAFPYLFPVYLVRNIKDRQFHSSVKAGVGILILFPLWYTLLTVLVGIFTGPWWIWVAFLVSLFPMGKIALWWVFRWKKTLRGSWFARRLRRRDQAAWDLVKLREEIISDTEALVSV